MTKKKKYLIEIFLKCSKCVSSATEMLDFNEKVLRASYPSVSSEDFDKIIAEEGYNRYLEETSLIIDSHFSQEEVESLIEFFSSTIGRKLVDYSHLSKMKKIINDISTDREKELSRLDRE